MVGWPSSPKDSVDLRQSSRVSAANDSGSGPSAATMVGDWPNRAPIRVLSLARALPSKQSVM